MNGKGYVPHPLWREVGSELGKNAENIDPDFISQKIDTLCALEKLSVPALSNKQLIGKAVRFSILADMSRKKRLKFPFNRRVIFRSVAVACLILVCGFSFNFLLARSTGKCVLSIASNKTCCGTAYCPCKVAVHTPNH